MTSFAPPELNLTDPGRGYLHFVLYTEPRIGAASAAWNATVTIEASTPYVREWVERLQRCQPSALHTTFVDSQEIPKLFHPCVDEDKASPAAQGERCYCLRTWADPEFGLPVVGRHHRGIGGDRWTYLTYAPLALRPDDVVASVITDRGDLFWARTTTGVLAVLPMLEAHAYGAGPTAGTGGAGAFAAYLQQLAQSQGRNTAAHGRDTDSPALLNWARSTNASPKKLHVAELATLLSDL